VKINETLLQKARGYAFHLLKFRLRSEKEIYQRLKKKGFQEEIASETVRFLKSKGFIDDEIFARAWVESRIKKPLGLRKIRGELNLKGIDKAIIDSQVNEIKKGYSEPEIVAKIIKDRLRKSEGVETYKAKSRIYGYLLRRGFSSEVIIEAMKEYS